MRNIFLLSILFPNLALAQFARPSYLERVEAINQGLIENSKSCQRQLSAFPTARKAADALKANYVHFVFENWEALSEKLFFEHGLPLTHEGVNRDLWQKFAIEFLGAGDWNGFSKGSLEVDMGQVTAAENTNRDVDAMFIKLGLCFNTSPSRGRDTFERIADRLHGHVWSTQLRRWLRLGEREKFDLVYRTLARLYSDKP